MTQDIDGNASDKRLSLCQQKKPGESSGLSQLQIVEKEGLRLSIIHSVLFLILMTVPVAVVISGVGHRLRQRHFD